MSLQRQVIRAYELFDELRAIPGVRIDLMVEGGYRGARERKSIQTTEIEVIVPDPRPPSVGDQS